MEFKMPVKAEGEDLFGWGFKLPLPGGNIETLLKEGNREDSCLYTEYCELYKQKGLTPEQHERKKQIVSILQKQIAVMKTRQEEERKIQEKIARQELLGTQLALFPAWLVFRSKKSIPTVCF